MTQLDGRIVKTVELSRQQIRDMFQLMDLFYTNMDLSIFLKDLSGKDYCILLEKKDGELAGFSTQKLLSIPVSGQIMHGVFSGDTIIHRDYWGSPELFLYLRDFFSRMDADTIIFTGFSSQKDIRHTSYCQPFSENFIQTSAWRRPLLSNN